MNSNKAMLMELNAWTKVLFQSLVDLNQSLSNAAGIYLIVFFYKICYKF